MRLNGSPQLEPGRAVFVLLHKDKTHVASLPDGTADWDYDPAVMKLRQKILEKDFGNRNYTVISLKAALVLIANKQAELEKLWSPVIKEIQRAKTLEDAWNIYVKAERRAGPHPMGYDAYLRKKLQID